MRIPFFPIPGTYPLLATLQEPQPEPVPPVASLLAKLSKARNSMQVERDAIDHELRLLAERSRQLTACMNALEQSIERLANDELVAAVAKEIADAEGE